MRYLVLIFLFKISFCFSQTNKTDSFSSHLVKKGNDVYVAGIVDSVGAGFIDIQFSKLDTTGDLSWSYTLGGTGKELIKSIKIIEDNLLLFGVTSSKGQGFDDFLLSSIDNAGVSKNLVIGSEDHDKAKKVISIENGELLCSGISQTGLDDFDIVKFEIDNNLSTIKRAIKLTHSGNENLESVKSLSDNTRIFVGSTNYYDGSQDDIFIVKIDSDDNFIWGKLIYDSTVQKGLDVVVDDENNIYISGYNGNSFIDGFIIKLNSIGDVLWQKSYSTVLSEKFNKIEYYKGSLFISGYVQSTTGSFDDILVSKLDTSGNLIWAKQLEYPNEEYASEIVVNDFKISVGGSYKSLSTPDWSFISVDLDSLGNSCRSRNITLTVTSLSLISKDINFNVIPFLIQSATSFTPVLQSNASSQVFFCNRTDTSTLSIDDTNLNEFVKIYPTYFNDYLNIESISKIEKVVITNYLGKKMFELKVNDVKQKIHLANLPNGFYIISVVLADQIQSVKIVKY